ncbi:hypothetical protein [Ornithinibacillus contaminans]|uniref:hypothetical protein n=1 Tax=Ornithinibacillus contaminans TaxID=694055 RepID=UPI00064D9D1B|nr:hypothetical protein [Ornithinibacillus contaminans]
MILKRYWKLLSIVLVIVVVLATFYINSALASKQYPELVMKTISGDEAAVEGLTLLGDYSDPTNLHGTFKVSLDGISYKEEQSYFKKIDPTTFTMDALTTLRDSYRNFMRGKQGDPALYFEDDSFVAYATIESKRNFTSVYQENFTFDITVLNKESEETTSLKINVPDQRNVSFMEVWDVQVIDGNLQVITRTEAYRSQENETSLRMYIFDLEAEQLIGDETISNLSIADIEASNGWYNIADLNNRDQIGKQKYLLFVEEKFIESTVNEAEDMVSNQVKENGEYVTQSVVNTTTERKVFVYDVEAKERTELELSEEIKAAIQTDSFYSTATSSIYNGTALFTVLTETGLKVVGYDMDTQAEVINQTFELPYEDVFNSTIRIVDNRLYVVEMSNNEQNPMNIYVGDIDSGELLYKGEIEMKNLPKNVEEILFVYDMIIN